MTASAGYSRDEMRSGRMDLLPKDHWLPERESGFTQSSWKIVVRRWGHVSWDPPAV